MPRCPAPDQLCLRFTGNRYDAVALLQHGGEFFYILQLFHEAGLLLCLPPVVSCLHPEQQVCRYVYRSFGQKGEFCIYRTLSLQHLIH